MGRVDKKLEALRKELKKNKLAAFIIPMNDEFQNEYIPDCAKRVEWISGFTGSAGTAVVTNKKAAFFTDGRYILQAGKEIDAKLYETHNIADVNHRDWILNNLKENDVVGFDPWLHTENNIKNLKTTFDRKKISLKPEVNLVDSIWHDRPAASLSKVKMHDIKFSGETAGSKRKRICEEIKRIGADAFLITSPESICWLLNIRGNDVLHTPLVLAYAIIFKNGSINLYIDKRKIGRLPGVAITDISTIQEGLRNVARKKKVVVDPDYISFRLIEVLEKSGAEIIRKQDLCLLPRACKNKVEMEGARKAHARDGVAVTKFLFWLDKNYQNKNITEISASEYLEGLREDNAFFEDLSFPTISGFKGNGAIVHYRSTPKTNKAIRGDGIYLVDSGAQYLDGTTDITRTVCIGKATKQEKEDFTRVLKGHIAIAKAIFPKNTTGAELDALARYNLWQAGKDYDHGTGHGVGSYLSVHEGPQRISRRGNAVLKPGMIISNEPGYYKAGEYGIRIENLVLVKESKNKGFLEFETLTCVPIDSRLIEKSMLTKEEDSWLKSYHLNVIKKIKPFLNKAEIVWLENLMSI